MAGWALRRRITAEQAVGWTVLAAVMVFVLSQLHLALVFANTTQLNGDLGGHMNTAALLRDHLLPHGRLSGWSSDWFTGFPALTYYFPVGILLVVLLDVAMPLNVAAKTVASATPALLPLGAYAFGRLSGCDRLTSALLAVGAVPLLLQPGLFVAGGSFPASVGGEYAFGLGLAFGLVVLGLARRGLRTGRHRALTAGLLAVTGLTHIIPAVVVAIGIVVSALLRPTWARARWTAAVGAVAAALTGFWALPFLLGHRFTAGPDFPNRGSVWESLAPVGMRPVLAVAVLGVVALYLKDGLATVTDEERRDDTGVFCVTMALVSAALFAFLPEGQVSNTRFLPVWLLWVGLVAGHQLGWLARQADAARQQPDRRWASRGHPALVQLLVPVVAFLAILPLWDTRWGRGVLTRGTAEPAASATDYVQGYERSALAGPYQAFIDAVRGVARDHGCGRAHTEWDAEGWAGQHVMLMWLIPYWTDGCIGTAQGLYIESSATSSFVNLANSRLSPTPSLWNARARPDFDLAAGLADLRTLGVRYLVASRVETRRAADASPDLRPVAQASEVDGSSWRIYELTTVAVVEPLRYEPVVVAGTGSSRSAWEDTVHRWYEAGRETPRERDVVVATDGPEQWPRRPRLSGDLPRRPTPDATVGRVRVERDRVSFDVSRTGVPVLVKVSYYPNWRASGAEGPWRVTPNQMVVIPTERTVTLRYGRIGVEYAGWGVTLAGVVGLVLLARLRPRPRPDPVVLGGGIDAQASIPPPRSPRAVRRDG
jgi:hypothetical protein